VDKHLGRAGARVFDVSGYMPMSYNNPKNLLFSHEKVLTSR